MKKRRRRPCLALACLREIAAPDGRFTYTTPCLFGPALRMPLTGHVERLLSYSNFSFIPREKEKKGGGLFANPAFLISPKRREFSTSSTFSR